jgi:hypothetical protein
VVVDLIAVDVDRGAFADVSKVRWRELKYVPTKFSETESPGVFVYAEDPPQKSVTLFVVHDPLYFNAGSLSSTVVLVRVALHNRQRGLFYG